MSQQPVRIEKSNPMRWDCSAQGCFNQKKRPKIEEFAECFPGRIAMGDVDAIVELGGCLCILEFKDPGARVPLGQEIMGKAITSGLPGSIYVFVGADVESNPMIVRRVRVIEDGSAQDWASCDLSGLKAMLRGWARQVRPTRRV